MLRRSSDVEEMSISEDSFGGEVTCMFDDTIATPYGYDAEDSDSLGGDDTLRDECTGSHSQYFNASATGPNTPVSQDQLDADRVATEWDVQEATDKIPPLLMRYCPDGTPCIATLNINNCFLVKIMLRCNTSIIVIQEPQHSSTSDESGKFINKTL